MQVAEGGKGIEEDKTGTEPDGGGGGVSAKGGCGDYRGRGCGGGGDGGEDRNPAAKEGLQAGKREGGVSLWEHRGSGELCRCRRSTQCHIVSM